MLCYLSFYAKCCQANSTNKALHTPWCHIIFGLWRVSLAEYILILRVYSLLLQMTWCIMAIVRTAFIQLWMRTKPWGMVLLSYHLCSAFAGNDHGMWDTCELFVNFASAIWTCFVITMWTLMYVRYLWTICELWCNMWLVVLNHIRSWFVCWFVWDPSWFHRTTGFICAQVWQFDRFSDCYCTCALINWMVLL